LELVVVLAIIGVMAVIGFPTFSGWISRARLRDAARTVFSDMQLARIRAIENGGFDRDSGWRLEFDPAAGAYTVISQGADMLLGTDDDITEKTVPLLDDNPGVSFGTDQGPIPDASEPDDGVSFNGNRVDFLPMGRADRGGTVYLKNERGETFAISLEFNNARVKMWRNYGGNWED
jgi:type IV fimbrial biogenesis protein FimT